jgi:hypothetical protein
MDRAAAAVENSFKKNAQAFLLLASSLIVLIASAKVCDTLNTCTGIKGWAVACSTISLLLALVYLALSMVKQSMSETVAPFLSLFLAIWWFPGAFVMTFDGPFQDTGNGYFGAWASLVFAVQWFQICGGPIFSKFMPHSSSNTDNVQMSDIDKNPPVPAEPAA